MEKKYYVDCAKSIDKKLRREVNGFVSFELYPEVDTIIFKIVFKDFNFSKAIGNVSDIYLGAANSIDNTVANIVKSYRCTVLNAFFKSEERKERERQNDILGGAYVD